MAKQRRSQNRKSPAKTSNANSSATLKRGGIQAGVATAHIKSVTPAPWVSVLAALLVFLVASPAVVGPYWQDYGYAPDLTMAAYIQVGVMVVLSLFVLSLFGRKQIVMPRSPLLLPLAIFYAWAMLSILWAHTKYEAIVTGLEWSAVAVGVLLISLILQNPKHIKAMLLGVFVSGLLISLLAIAQFLLGVDWVLQSNVPGATFVNKNMSGQYGLMTLPIAVACFLRADKKHEIWIFAIASALMTTHIFYTHTRGAWLGFILQLILFALFIVYLKFKHEFHPLRGIPGKKLSVVVALSLALGLSYLTPVMLGTLDKVEQSAASKATQVHKFEHGGVLLNETIRAAGASRNIRLIMWGNSISMFKEHFLFGVGLGNWTIHYPRYQSSYRKDGQLMKDKYHMHAHNDYLEILCELGIIGFALFIWFVVALLRTISVLLRQGDKESFFLVLPGVVVIAGVALNAVFSFPLKLPVSIFLLAVYVALLSNLYSATVHSGQGRVLTLPSQSVRGVAVVVTVMLTVSIFSLRYNWHQATKHHALALMAQSKSDFSRFSEEAEKAAVLNPLDKDSRVLKAYSIQVSKVDQANEKAAVELKKVLDYYPYDLSVMLGLEKIYQKLGRWDDSIVLLEDALSVNRSRALKERYENALYHAGRYKEAVEQAKQREIPNLHRMYEHQLHLLKKKPSSVLEEFEEKFHIGIEGFSLEKSIQTRISNIRKLLKFCQNASTPSCKGRGRYEIKSMQKIHQQLYAAHAKIKRLESQLHKDHKDGVAEPNGS